MRGRREGGEKVKERGRECKREKEREVGWEREERKNFLHISLDNSSPTVQHVKYMLLCTCTCNGM